MSELHEGRGTADCEGFGSGNLKDLDKIVERDIAEIKEYLDYINSLVAHTQNWPDVVRKELGYVEKRVQALKEACRA